MPVNRRHFLAGTLSVAAAGAATACAESRDAVVNAQQEPAIDLATATVPFDGIHQAGISTPQQSSLNLIGFNFKDGVDKPAIVRLMRLWTEDARASVSYTHLTLPTIHVECRSRWSPYH